MKMELQNNLTEDKWLQWEIDLLGGFYSVDVLKATYAKLETSEGLKKNFLSYPSALQLNIVHNLGETWSNAEDIFTESELRVRMNESLPPMYQNEGGDVVNWITANSEEIFECIRQNKEDSDADLAKFSHTLKNFQEFYLKQLRNSEGSEFVVPLMLSMVYSIDLVEEIIAAFVPFSLESKISNLVYLCDNWKTLKDYPIDWIANLV